MQFEISTPVTNANFFDRSKELERLLFSARNLPKGSHNWVAVLGHRKVGKSSLLFYDVNDLKEGKGKNIRIDEKTRAVEDMFSMI